MLPATKRSFLQGLGATVGAAFVAESARAATGRADGVWDVIVVGGGTAGLPAAIFAADRGARVLLIERSGRLGGTLPHVEAHATLAAAGTRFQTAQGIVDTPEAHFEDAMRLSGGTADPDIVRLYTRHAAPVIDWLADHGFQIKPGQPVATGYNGDFKTARLFQGIEGGRTLAKALNAAMAPQVRSGRLRVVIRSSLVELVQDKASVVRGVVTRDDDGRRSEHRARSVVLAAGGCSANPALYERLHGVPMYGREAYQFNQGAGIEAALAAGARLWNADKYIPYFGAVMTDVNFPTPRLTVASTDARYRPPWEIFVNAAGARFVREDEPDLRTRMLALGQQPGQRYWIVFDADILEKAQPLLDLPRDQWPGLFENHVSFAMADSVDQLATAMGVDAAGLARTVAAYNGATVSGADALGRKHMPLPIVRPPFYGVLHQGWTFTSFAGIAVDDRLRVQSAKGGVIPNLYAAGEVIGGGATAGRAASLGGHATPALAFGRLLGATLLPV
jgi:fumarate reductase flavoprotein subunit